MSFLPPVVIPIKVARNAVLRDIKITSPGNPSTTTVEIDGEPYRNAQAIKFEVTAENWALAEIRFLPSAFAYEGKAAVSVDEQTAQLLESLGWTPPNG
ncbi:hypothetical protein ACFFGR_09230 [Arthrobacter liuii]|uniref:PEGA domain-containing protein n=1 Tax=Arthrobacter liuii TaxID=1476996 RepID=A0ABQ2AMN3_9MICC|nr:hypothetical protein [Arthrobacter liuii]GGH93784.1 hypothetical protein GCM10007170_15460 [Arthrobacter liuii]